MLGFNPSLRARISDILDRLLQDGVTEIGFRRSAINETPVEPPHPCNGQALAAQLAVGRFGERIVRELIRAEKSRITPRWSSRPTSGSC